MADSSPNQQGTTPIATRGRNLQVVSERQTEQTETIAESLKDLQDREAKLSAKEKDLQQVMSAVQVAFGILGARAVVMLSLLASVGAFGWAVAEPTALRISASVLFTVIVFLPALWADARRN